MKLSVNLISGGRFIPAGIDVDPALVPEHIKKTYDRSTQAQKKVPKYFQGPRLTREDGTVITDQEEDNRVFQEREEEIMRRSGVPFYDLGQPERVIEPDSEDGLSYYDIRQNQGVPEPSKRTLEAWRMAEGEEDQKEVLGKFSRRRESNE